ncbi:MAG: energy-coupling factor transporter ATPase, partial [Anaerolineaceae bacterium]|nr:energy-coupling factor transporter ATPase [Anaerolineaceae bacterium]
MNGLIPHFHKGRMSGDVLVLGINTREHTVAEMAEHVGMVFQDFEAQLFSTNVVLEVAFGPENFAVERDEIRRRVDENLAYVGLSEYYRRPPSTLSGGQKQKLAIASTLALQPTILVMDEPTTDLDPISKLGIFDITNQLRKREDILLIVVEHESEETLNADRIILIKDGKVVKEGTPRRIHMEVELLESLGIMPLGIPRFFKMMGYKELPITPDEGEQAFRQAGWKLSDEKYEQIMEGDRQRQARYSHSIIQCRELVHTYPNGVQALQGINLDIYQGEMIAIVGQNGSGKTTLAKHINGLLMPTGGEIDVFGAPTQAQGVFKLGQKVGYVFQNPDHQIFSETVFAEVAFSPTLGKQSKAEIAQRVQEALNAVGLEGLEEEDPFTLTKSGRQRVAVASVLAAQPEVLILDEPTTGLDYAEQRSMMEMVKRLNEQGSTIIFITHHMWVVAEYAQRVFVMRDGKLLLEGSTRQVFSHGNELHNAFLRPPHFVDFSN